MEAAVTAHAHTSHDEGRSLIDRGVSVDLLQDLLVLIYDLLWLPHATRDRDKAIADALGVLAGKARNGS
jgi:hypothetical protein